MASRSCRGISRARPRSRTNTRAFDWCRTSYGAGYADVNESACPLEVTVNAPNLPEDLVGTYFRNGPGLFTRGGNTTNHPFDGDGFITRITLPGDGTLSFRGDFVKTDAYVEEKRANRRLYRNSFGTQRDGGPLANAFDVTQKNIANTNVLVWPTQTQQDDETPKLLALWEAAQPHRLNPTTLETEGVDYINGLLRPGAPFGTGIPDLDRTLSEAGVGVGGKVLAAHPHVDPRDGRLVCCGTLVVPKNGSLATEVTFYELDKNLKPIETSTESLDSFILLHDFAFTDEYYIVAQSPLELKSFPFVLGFKGPGEPECINFKSTGLTTLHLIPRPQAARRRSLQRTSVQVPSCFIFHFVNAHQKDDKVIIDVVQTKSFSAWHPDRSLEASFGGFHRGLASGTREFLDSYFDVGDTGRLVRYDVDVASNSANVISPLSDRTVEFPRLNDNQWSRSHRYAYVGASRHPTRAQPLQCWTKVDYSTVTTEGRVGEQVLYDAGEKGFVGEPTFVPRANTSGREDDGYLIGMVFNGETLETDFVVVDARGGREAIVVNIPDIRLPLPALHGTYTRRVFL